MMQTFFAILHLRLLSQLKNTSSFDIPVKNSDKPQYLPLKTSITLEHISYHIQRNKIHPGQKKCQGNYFSCKVLLGFLGVCFGFFLLQDFRHHLHRFHTPKGQEQAGTGPQRSLKRCGYQV